MKNLSELKVELIEKRKQFDHYRIANGKVLKYVNQENKQEILLEDKEDEDIENLVLVDNNDAITVGEDNVMAVKSYTEKIKGGYFGKRRTRF